MEEKNHNLLQPLIQTTPKNSYENDQNFCSNSSIVLRIFMVIFVGVVSLWANYEESKGFSITIVNESIEEGTFASKRFDLFYVLNDEATRLVLKTSKFAEDTLYSISDKEDSGQSQIKKQVKHVMLRLSSRNLTRPVIVDKSLSNDGDEFVIHISPSILEGVNYRRDMFLALQESMARIWLWDGQGNAPSSLVNGMIEYITSLASSSAESESESVEPVKLDKSSCWKSENTRTIVNFLNYCERKREGFVKRLNKEMKNGWHEKMIDDALGIPSWHLCESYNNSTNE